MSEPLPKECTGVEIKVPWGHISAKWWGPQTNRPLLALHGWQDNAGTFDLLIPLLPAHVGVLAIDFPGHGLSSPYPEGRICHPYTDYVYVVRMIMKEYGWKKVSIIGHSMGCGVGFLFAAVFPELVDFFIGLDNFKRYPHSELKFTKNVRETIDGFMATEERRRVDCEPPSYTYETCIEKLHEGTQNSIDREKCPYILERNVKKSTKYPDKYYFSRDGRIKYVMKGVWPQRMFTKILSNIQCPVLLIKAKHSPLFDDPESFEESINVLKRSPKFEYYTVEGRHHVHLNEPEKVSGIINAFIDKYAETVNAKL